jgi:hypothetical protein
MHARILITIGVSDSCQQTITAAVTEIKEYQMETGKKNENINPLLKTRILG